MKRLVGTLLSGALAFSGSALLTPPTASAADGLTPTKFAFSALGYSTRLVGGELPAGSRTTAYQIVGCTNDAGKTKENHVAEAELPGLGSVTGARTDIATTQRNGVTATRTRNSIERLVLAQDGFGSLTVDALTTTTRAWHDSEGFHARTTTSVGTLVFTDPMGQEQELDLPTPDQPVTIPGLVRIKVGRSVEKSDAHAARASGEALRINVLATGTLVKVAHADASIAGGVKSGIFGGRSSAIRTEALQDNVSVGAQPLSIMYCQGTRGRLIERDLAGVDLDEGVEVDGLSSTMRADQTSSRAWGTMTGKVARVDIGGGQVVIEAITGRAHVEREGGDVLRSADGSTIGSVTIDGEAQEFPDSDVIEVPGLVRLERNVISRTPNSISVIALKVTLLDGDGAVVRLGEARMVVQRAGL